MSRRFYTSAVVLLAALAPAARADNADIAFMNFSSACVEVFYVKPDGLEMRYGELLPGQAHRQSTYGGHVWRIRDKATGTLLKEYKANRGFQTVALSPQAARGATELAFMNFTRSPVQVSTANPDGTEKALGYLEPSHSHTLPARVGETWVFRDKATLAVLKRHTVTAGHQAVAVEPAGGQSMPPAVAANSPPPPPQKVTTDAANLPPPPPPPPPPPN